jgi:hypothetical protein
MERAGRIIGKLQIKPVEVAGVKTYHLAPRAWTAAVGKTIAAHTRPVFLDGSTLIVEVEDLVWKAQLTALHGDILPRIEKIAGSGMVRRIEFRVAAPRRMPMLAKAATAGAGTLDESDSIIDPVMRRVYRTARRKASA